MTPPAPRAFALAIALALTSNAVLAEAPLARAANTYLTQAEAAARSARVANVHYVLDFALTGKESFGGTSVIGFDLSDNRAPLTLDLDRATISALVVNGKTVAPQYNQFFITLQPQDLLQGRNSVSVSYQRQHSTNGEGLHRMVDPADGKVYTYSHFEPAAAHQMFALFDQPDLKATYQVNVTAPADWVVVSTTRESAVQADLADPAVKRWTFPPTKKLSPYNFSLHAGPYKVWEDNSGTYPMRLFARQSVAAQVTPGDWFTYTRQGLAFFDNYFGVPYQFEKYDQLLVPDFLYGAMENAGAVTFAERAFLHKAEMTAAQRERLAGVIMHEMAHQWFGDLVTMKWWNGLWLNESFASFMGTLATAEATEFKNAWQGFYSGAKQGAYFTDQSSATHPIEVPVPSTANAFDNIDAITYAKGASVLMQLRHLLGEEVFRKGVHNYLVKYAYKNAQLDDFIGSLGEAAGRDLGAWTQQWLYHAGVNTIAANYRCANGKISRFTLQQSAPSAALPTLREQHVQVATFTLDGGQLALAKNVALTYTGAATQVPALVGSVCPDLVYPNYQDWGFAKVRLDQRSFATAQSSLSKVDDPLLRSMLWQSLWDGVRDSQLPLNAFIDTALANAAAEKDYTLLGNVLGMLESSRRYLDAMHGDAAYAAYAQKTSVAMEALAWAGVEANKGDSNFLRRWFGHYLNTASSQVVLARLAAILDGSLVVDNLAVGQDVRWAIIARLNRYAYPGSAELVSAELARDKSDSGQSAALAATVIRPDSAIKAEWLAKVKDLKTSLPFSKVRVAITSLYPAEQAALSEASAAARLASLPAMDKAAGPVFMRSFTELIPLNCTPASVKRLDAAAAQYKDLSAGIRRALLGARQEDQRCLLIRRAMTLPKT
ncbi:MAG: aminopeptidase N [Massilia sp.]|nr:aminopeptidase N [Massilia sp.]